MTPMIRDDGKDMKHKDLAGCAACGKTVRHGQGTLATVRDGATEDLKPWSEDTGFRPVLWRYFHTRCYEEDRWSLYVKFPLTFVGWHELTIRLLDHKGAWYLFEITNWRWVLDCVAHDVPEQINDFKNKPDSFVGGGKKKLLKRKPVAKSEPAKLVRKPLARKPLRRRAT